MRTLVFVFSVMIFSFSAQAINLSACSGLLNKGWYKTYKYMGIDQPATKATKAQGTTKGSSAITTEASTASLDPKYWSNVSTSNTQSISSYGQCSALGMLELKEKRELYFVQNRDIIEEEMSQGKGLHLEVLALFALCDEDAQPVFRQLLQRNTARFLEVKNLGYGHELDQLIQSESSLKGRCHSFEA